MTVAKPNRCSSDQFLTPFVFLQRWKQEEINIGLSHHLLVYCSKVRHPAEDFDYFLLVCQTRSSLRSLSLFSPFFSLLFYALIFLCFFLYSFPCCLCCSSLIWWFSAHQVWPVVISSPLASIPPPFPPVVAKSRHTPIIHKSQSCPEVRGQSELARVLLTSVCVW